MRVSLQWLKQYVTISDSPQELAETLTMQGLEVESIENLAERFAHFVVGEVLDVGKHPHADKLTVCKVDTGKELLQIVCGAPNVAPNQKVAVGLVGAVVPHDQHNPKGEPFVLSQVNIRGIDSFGMICSAYELGLGEDKNGILILEAKAKTGIPLAEHLGSNDIVFEIGVTPNRPDALSHVGVAREIGARLGKKLKLPSVKLKESGRTISGLLRVNIRDNKSCPRYTARVVLDVTVGDSPLWLQSRLRAVGIRPINNIVDVTNYVLMEIGQPLHAFDYDKISGREINVQRSEAGYKFITLDKKVHSLRDDTLMICDSTRPVAIGGVMGGENSEISSSTKNIVLESAYFAPGSIRKTSKHLSITTDASQRFERGTDPNITRWAVDRAAGLIQQIAGGEVVKGVIDGYPRKILPRTISLRINKVNEILGTTLSKEKVSSLLARLNIPSRPEGKKKSVADKATFIVPTFRPDLEREIDLIEEVARIYGYNNIETKTKTALNVSSHAPIIDFSDDVRAFFVGRGFHEVVANSMQEAGIASLATDTIINIANPISKEMASMRTSLIPGMLEIIRNNINHDKKDIRLFEIGKVYFSKSSATAGKTLNDYTEEERFIISVSGMSHPMRWAEKPRFVDLFDIKGELQAFFQKIFLDKFKLIPYSTPTKALTKQGLVIEINGERIGSIGSVSPQLLERYKIEQEVFVGELALGVLEKTKLSGRKYAALQKYPMVLRDIAMIVDSEVAVEALEHEISKAGQPLVKSITLFDIYIGEQVGVKKKSCAFALEFQSEEHTLSQAEIDRVMQRIIQALSEKFNSVLRT